MNGNRITNWGRRMFITNLTKAVGATLFIGAPWKVSAGTPPVKEGYTVGDIMEQFIKAVPGGPIQNTVDTLKAGHRDIKVTGIVTTMFPTVDIIQKTAALGANFIIAHEPAFYNHADDVAWLEKDAVYLFKKALLEKHNIAIWRNHDYVHRYLPDGVQTAVVSALGWTAYQDGKVRSRLSIPPLTLANLVQHLKKRLNITGVRYICDLQQTFKKVLLMPVAYPGKLQIEAIGREAPDVVVVGEIQEWETAEYIRDARASGQKIALVVMGHIDSEEPGSRFMADWLKANVAGVPVHHIPTGNAMKML